MLCYPIVDQQKLLHGLSDYVIDFNTYWEVLIKTEKKILIILKEVQINL